MIERLENLQWMMDAPLFVVRLYYTDANHNKHTMTETTVRGLLLAFRSSDVLLCILESTHEIGIQHACSRPLGIVCSRCSEQLDKLFAVCTYVRVCDF
jgi:hypothetical protein